MNHGLLSLGISLFSYLLRGDSFDMRQLFIMGMVSSRFWVPILGLAQGLISIEGELYFNVHTPENLGGELGGQIERLMGSNFSEPVE